MAGGFSIAIKATDETTKVINKINGALGAQQKKFNQLTAPVTRLGASIKKFGDVSGITKLGKSLAPIAEKAKNAALSIASMAPALATVVSGASLAGVANLINHWSTLGRALTQTSAQTRVSVEHLQQLGNVGEQVGVSSDVMSSAVKNLGVVLSDALVGRNGAQMATQYLEQMGLGMHNAAFQSADLAGKTEMLREHLAGIADPIQRAAIATEFFKGDAEALSPYLAASSKRIAELTAESKKYVLTLEQTKGADEFARQQTLLGIALKYVGGVLSSLLAPYLEKIIKSMREFVDTWATTENINKAAKYVTDFIETLRGLGTRINSIVEYFGGWETAIKAIVAIQLFAWVAPLIGVVLALGSAIWTVTAAMIANPIGLLIIAFAALTAGIIYSYYHWDQIKGYIVAVWEKIKFLFPVVDALISAWEPVSKFFADMWKGITEHFEKGYAHIKPIIDGIAKAAGMLKFWGKKDDAPEGTVRANTLSGEGDAVSGGSSDVVEGGASGSSGSSGGGIGGWIRRQFGGGGGASSSEQERKDAAPVKDWQVDDMKKLVAMGMSKNDAAGVIGNIAVESAGNHKAVGDKGQAFGLGQWHPDRQAIFKQMYGKNIQDSTHDEQLKFYYDELKLRKQVPNAASPAEAATPIMQNFEVPQDRIKGGANDIQRSGIAENTYKAYMAQQAALAQSNAPASGVNLAQTGKLDKTASNDGNVNVSVNITGDTKGVTAKTTSSGNVTAPPARVSPMSGVGAIG